MITSTANTVILAVILVVAVIAVAWLMSQRQRSARLKRRFGPEYERTVSELHSPAKAEAELAKREQRVARMTIVPLTPSDAARFSEAWNALQGRFVDDPKGAVIEAEHLVRELMAKRGYPMSDFERMSEDISVDHPTIVAAYRAAQAVATRAARGEEENAEELRKAVIHFRTLFEELLEVRPAKAGPLPPTRRTAVHS